MICHPLQVGHADETSAILGLVEDHIKFTHLLRSKTLLFINYNTNSPIIIKKIICHLLQVGHADETSAILGLVEDLKPRCGNQCPCLTSQVVTTTPAPKVINPAPDNITAPTRAPSGKRKKKKKK